MCPIGLNVAIKTVRSGPREGLEAIEVNRL